MSFLREKKLKLSELQCLEKKINQQRKDDPFLSANSDSTILRLFSERKRKIQELLEIYAAEEADYVMNREDRQILDGFEVQLGNVHEGENVM